MILLYAEHALSDRLLLEFVMETNRIQRRDPLDHIQVRVEHARRVAREHGMRLIWC